MDFVEALERFALVKSDEVKPESLEDKAKGKAVRHKQGSKP